MLPSQIAADPTAAARAQRCASAIWPSANSYFLLLSTVLLYDYGSKDILLVWLVGGSHDKGTCQFAPNANVPEIIGNPAYSFSGTLDYEEPDYRSRARQFSGGKKRTKAGVRRQTLWFGVTPAYAAHRVDHRQASRCRSGFRRAGLRSGWGSIRQWERTSRETARE